MANQKNADTVGLHTLDLAGNPIGSLAPLAARELWTHVGLARLTAPVDLTEITDPALTIDSLDLSGNGLSDASALMDAELGIRALDLSKNHLTAFPALGGGLWELHLDENPLIAVAPLPPSLRTKDRPPQHQTQQRAATPRPYSAYCAAESTGRARVIC